jgi:hypothetical protein
MIHFLQIKKANAIYDYQLMTTTAAKWLQAFVRNLHSFLAVLD